jgi:hypothetical protein
MDNDVIPSPISALLAAGISYNFMLGEGVMIIIVLSSIFILSPSSLLDQSAFGTFPGENGKIAFTSQRDGNAEIYVMNAADGSGQTRLTNNPASDGNPDFGPAPATEPPPVEDTTPPVIAVPKDITVEATSPGGATVSFEVNAQDAEDGAVDVNCDHNSGETFPIGETVVTCSSEDAAGNRAEESFTITVQDTTAPHVEITKAVDKKGLEIADGSATKSHYIQITFETTDAVGIDNTECSLDGQVFTPSCTSPVVYDGLKKGTHNFTVRSTDAAGNTGQEQFTWIVNPPGAVGAPGRQ